LDRLPAREEVLRRESAGMIHEHHFGQAEPKGGRGVDRIVSR